MFAEYKSLRDSSLSVTDASGRHISLLNTDNTTREHDAVVNNTAAAPSRGEMHDRSARHSVGSPQLSGEASPSSSESAMETYGTMQRLPTEPEHSKRKYHCTEPGCNKSFTTSGHLARHNRIHTGEKNFPCLFPGCQSRFSRQDNMMQHYRTHMAPKSRRSHKRGPTLLEEEARPRPRLHAHHRIRSDPIRGEPPLTIDQHLHNYHRSLLPPASDSDTLSAGESRHCPASLLSTSTMERQPSKDSLSQHPPSAQLSPSPSVSVSSAHINDPVDTDDCFRKSNPVIPSPSSSPVFFQHRPLRYCREQTTTGVLPFTLLHPECTTESAPSSNSLPEPVSENGIEHEAPDEMKRKNGKRKTLAGLT